MARRQATHDGRPPAVCVSEGWEPAERYGVSLNRAIQRRLEGAPSSSFAEIANVPEKVGRRRGWAAVL